MQLHLENILTDNRSNNFNMIRLFMALGVLYNHSFVLFDDNGKKDAVKYIFTYFDTGSLSVSVFFFISGMLLTQSYFKTRNQLKFILKRLLRIFPGLLVCLFFTVLIVGPINTIVPLKQYFLERGTGRYLYNIFLSNEIFFFELPGCFITNKLPYVVNGSLWTLPYELICYIFLFFILVLSGLLKSSRHSTIKKVLMLFLFLFFAAYLLNGNYLLHRIVGLITGFKAGASQGNNSLPLFLFFFVGSLCYSLRKKIKLNFYYFVALCILLVVAHFFSIPLVFFLLEVMTICYGTLVWAGTRSLNRYNFKVDPSYGVYLYAWPVQQTFARFLHVSAYESLLYTIPVVVGLGWISYLFIERPAMDSIKIIYSRWLKEEPVKLTTPV